jgi:hypothetical protein
LYILSRYIYLNPVRVVKIEKVPLKEREKFLKQSKWSSLKGYLDKNHASSFVDYKTILLEYGGDNPKGPNNY